MLKYYMYIALDIWCPKSTSTPGSCLTTVVLRMWAVTIQCPSDDLPTLDLIPALDMFLFKGTRPARASLGCSVVRLLTELMSAH